MKNLTIRGNQFQIDNNGFVQSTEGSLGHLEDCEALAETLQSLFEIADQITI